MKKSVFHILAVGALMMSMACSTMRYVPEGEYLYKGASVQVHGEEVNGREQRVLSEELGSILRPRPNRVFLGLPLRLWVYDFWGTPGKEKGPGNWISRKFGEPPVLLSDVRTDYQRNLLNNRLENRGYFNAQIESDSTVSARRIKFKYAADPGRQYLIDDIYFPSDSSVLAREIRNVTNKSFLHIGDAFDLDVIKAERERINARLKEIGFYYFSPDDLLILADTTKTPYRVTLSVTVKPNTSAHVQERFSIRNIYIYPQHTLTSAIGDTITRTDSVSYNQFIIFDPAHAYRPRMFEKALVFKRGDLYNRTNHNRSLNKLIDLGVFKYVENKFKEVGNAQLDAYYYLTPYAKKSLRMELLGRNTSTNFTGAEVNVGWLNRNTFHGAENLRFKVYGGTDFQISGINKDNNLYRFGAEINLTIPGFITPFAVVTPVAYIPRTRLTLGFDKLNRVNSYVLNSFRASFGYHWKENIRKEHDFTVFGVNYIQPTNITAGYMQRLAEDPTLANAIQRQFILGPSYNYISTNTVDKNKKHTYYYNARFDLSGNLPGLLSGASFRDGDTKKILNAEFSQYIKTDHDLRYYNDLGRGSSFAARFFVGIGYAYGNSRALPFVKQYYAGGVSGIRAFRARALGPGTFHASNIGTTAIAADQTADIKLEMSIEYRPKISGILNGAIFIDAGNIWLLREDTDRPGAAISGGFLNGLAVGFGAGLRFDFSFFVLRGDLAFPLRKPWYPLHERWVINEIKLGSGLWRKENLVFNLAIDYPF